METAILITLISGLISFLGIFISNYSAKKYQNELEWKKEKLEHYRKLLIAISNLGGNADDLKAAHREYAELSNTICLVASPSVVMMLMELNEVLKTPVQYRDPSLIEAKVNSLMIEIREDIGLAKQNKNLTIRFRLVQPGGKNH